MVNPSATGSTTDTVCTKDTELDTPDLSAMNNTGVGETSDESSGTQSTHVNDSVPETGDVNGNTEDYENIHDIPRKGLKMLHLNICHLLPNLPYLKVQLDKLRFPIQILGFSETFLDEKIQKSASQAIHCTEGTVYIKVEAVWLYMLLNISLK